MRARTVAIAGVALLMGACGDESMRDQPRGNVFKANPLFADGAATRSWPVGTVAREPTPYEADDEGVMAPRPKVTMQELLLGQDRFITFCSPCHGEDGYGEGMIPRHTFPRPPSFHTDAARALADQDLYRIITIGLGKMPPYANQVIPAERWPIVDYIRALQRSQHATLADAPEWMGHTGRAHQDAHEAQVQHDEESKHPEQRGGLKDQHNNQEGTSRADQKAREGHP